MQNRSPIISVIVPVYGVEPYLRRCVDSILAQTFRDFELILVDDGSPDRCGEICDEYAKKDARVVVIHQKNGGLSAARNAGLDWAFKNSQSEWISFIDSDDFVLTDYLEKLLSGSQYGCDVVSAHAFRMEHPRDPIPHDTDVFVVTNVEKYWTEDPFHNSACFKLYRKSLFAEIRFPLGKLHEDEYVTFKILFSQAEIVCSDAQLYVYCVREDSITRKAWDERRTDSFGGIVGQCEYFHEHGFHRAFEEAISWLNRLSGTAIEHWHQISGARRRMIYCELNRVKVGWIVDPWQYRNMMLLRNPIWARIVFWVRHVFDFVRRRGVIGGAKYLFGVWLR